jgi:hypothetical protein
MTSFSFGIHPGSVVGAENGLATGLPDETYKRKPASFLKNGLLGLPNKVSVEK